MKIIHQVGFNHDELMAYQIIIFFNLLDSARAIILAMRDIGVDCEIPSNQVCSYSDTLSCTHILMHLCRET